MKRLKHNPTALLFRLLEADGFSFAEKFGERGHAFTKGLLRVSIVEAVAKPPSRRRRGRFKGYARFSTQTESFFSFGSYMAPTAIVKNITFKAAIARVNGGAT